MLGLEAWVLYLRKQSPHDTTWKYIIDDILRNTSHRLKVKLGLTEMEQTFYIQLFTFLLSSVGRVADS